MIGGQDLECSVNEVSKRCADSPAEADGVSPAKGVREIIESVRSREMELGILTGILNNRSVTRRGLFDGACRRALSQTVSGVGKDHRIGIGSRFLLLIGTGCADVRRHEQSHDQHAERTNRSL